MDAYQMDVCCSISAIMILHTHMFMCVHLIVIRPAGAGAVGGGGRDGEQLLPLYAIKKIVLCFACQLTRSVM